MASKYRKKFALPDGFYQVLEDYSREVLRDQPKDILEFSYLYFKHLEEVRILLFPCKPISPHSLPVIDIQTFRIGHLGGV